MKYIIKLIAPFSLFALLRLLKISIRGFYYVLLDSAALNLEFFLHHDSNQEGNKERLIQLGKSKGKNYIRKTIIRGKDK